MKGCSFLVVDLCPSGKLLFFIRRGKHGSEDLGCFVRYSEVSHVPGEVKPLEIGAFYIKLVGVTFSLIG